MDGIGKQFDEVDGSRRCARALSAARILSNRDVRSFLGASASAAGAKDVLDHFFRFVDLWENFVLEGGPGRQVAQAAAGYAPFPSGEALEYIWLSLSDAYLRAAHPDEDDVALGTDCDEGLRVRMFRFCSYFGLPHHYDASDSLSIHKQAKAKLTVPVATDYLQWMTAMYSSIWYRTQGEVRFSQGRVTRFVKRHF